MGSIRAVTDQSKGRPQLPALQVKASSLELLSFTEKDVRERYVERRRERETVRERERERTQEIQRQEESIDICEHIISENFQLFLGLLFFLLVHFEK